MRPLTIIRALHMLAFAICGWSLNMRWGDEVSVGKGPPGQWERQVVGAALLLFIAAVTAFVGARGKKKEMSPVALGIELLTSLGAAALALSLRSKALDAEMPHLLLGGGWLWMSAGAAMASGAAITSLALRFLKIEEPAAKKPSTSTPPAKRTGGKNTSKKSSKKSSKKKRRR